MTETPKTAKHTPGPWKVGHRAMDVVCVNAKIGGEAKLFDVRGWGYLTGHGHGGLGLDEQTAIQIQTANATLAAASPDLVAALEGMLAKYTMLVGSGDAGFWDAEKEPEVIAARAAIARATSSEPSA